MQRTRMRGYSCRSGRDAGLSPFTPTHSPQVSVLGSHFKTSLFSSPSILPFLPNKKPSCQLPRKFSSSARLQRKRYDPSAIRICAKVTLDVLFSPASVHETVKISPINASLPTYTYQAPH